MPALGTTWDCKSMLDAPRAPPHGAAHSGKLQCPELKCRRQSRHGGHFEIVCGALDLAPRRRIATRAQWTTRNEMWEGVDPAPRSDGRGGRNPHVLRGSGGTSPPEGHAAWRDERRSSYGLGVEFGGDSSIGSGPGIPGEIRVPSRTEFDGHPGARQPPAFRGPGGTGPPGCRIRHLLSGVAAELRCEILIFLIFRPPPWDIAPYKNL